MNLSDVINAIRPSVVQLAVHKSKGSIGIPIGTGFIVDRDGIVATANHVAEAALAAQTSGQIASIGLAYPNVEDESAGAFLVSAMGNFLRIRFDVVAADPENDIALLKLVKNPFAETPPDLLTTSEQSLAVGPSVAALMAERPHDGEAVAVSGYPLASRALVTTSGNIATSWGTDAIEAIDPKTGRVISDLRSVYLADISVNPGNSGAPVARLDDGAVIGICVAYVNSPVTYTDSQGGAAGIDDRPIGFSSGLAVVIPTSKLMALLASTALST